MTLYRPCVGIALFNQQGKVFVGERIDTPGAWQMPQGGIDEGETPEAAAFRELHEEIGTDRAEVIERASQVVRYDLPERLQQKLWHGRFVGQEQIWFAMRFTGTDDDINIHHHAKPEFSHWEWVDLGETIERIVPFKRDTYGQVVSFFEHLARA